MKTVAIASVSCLVLGACSSTPEAPSLPTVHAHGALRAMFHEGRTESVVSLETLLPNKKLYGVGALADLDGEITIVEGNAYLARPTGRTGVQTERVQASDAGAALLVTSEVDAWRSVVTEEAIAFEHVDEAIAELALLAGMDLGQRFPFLVEGRVEDLDYHVIDGRKLTGGGTSHAEHLAASVRHHLDETSVTLVGFFSTSDQGVFTHMGSTTHMHSVMPLEGTTGHVDHVTLPAGTTIRFPAR